MMKYLTTTFAIAFMAFGFTAISAQDVNARGDAGYCPEGQKYYQGSCYTTAQIDELESLSETAENSGGDFGGGGEDFGGDADRAAASTSAE